MAVLLLLLALPVLALVVRALTSGDPLWMRGLGVAVAALALLLLPANLLLDLRLSTAAAVAVGALAPAWLVGWAIVSRDAAPPRLVSLLAALPAAFALFLLYVSTEHYTE